MLHAIVRARVLLAMVVAACVGVWGLHLYPVQTENPFLGLIQLERPFVFQVLAYGYATLWFTTPFLAASLVTPAADAEAMLPSHGARSGAL